MSVFNFYVDTSTIDDRNKAEIILDTPIQTQPNEYLEVKVIDVSMMNDNYNISSSLNNNEFIINRNELVYAITETIPSVDLPIIDPEDFYHSANQNNLLSSVIRDDANGYEFLDNGEYKIYFYDTRILEGDNNHLIHNIFDNTQFNYEMRLSETYDTHFVVHNVSDTSYDFLKKVEIYIKFDGSSLATDTTFTFSVSHSNDGVNYTNFNVTDNEITFQAGTYNLVAINNKSIIINHPTIKHAYKYYRIKFVVDNAVINDTDFTFARLRFVKNTYTLTPTSFFYDETITIPDGFYNSTNFITTLNSLLLSYNLVLSIDSITNKLLIQNNNTTFVYHPYDDTDENHALILNITKNNLLKRLFGIDADFTTFPKNTITTADNALNLLHYQKLVLTTDLTFNVPTTHLLKEWKEDKADGMRNILIWCPVDYPPYTIIKYKNYEGLSYRINDTYIKNLNFYFYNEFKQSVDINRLLFHIQIIKKNISYY